MKSNPSKFAQTATITLALTFIFSCSDLPPLDDTPASSSSSTYGGSSSSSTGDGSSSSTGGGSSSSANGGGSSSSVVGSSGSVAAVTIWDGTADTTWYTNNKTKNSFLISTAEELAGLALLVNGTENNGRYNMQDKTIKLNADIMLNDTTNWQNWEFTSPSNIWKPIGINGYPFSGTFDGDGHIISGLFYEDNTKDFIGLFGNMAGGTTIKYLGVVAFYIYASQYVGGLVGYGNFTLNISNSYSKGIVKVKNEFAGGLVGATANIKDCYSTSTVTATGDYSDVGGLVGFNNNVNNIINSYSTGKVSAGIASDIGGLVGRISGTTITNSYYDSQTSGQTDTGKGEPKTTAEMQTADFATTLGTAFKHNPNGYPKLAWEK